MVKRKIKLKHGHGIYGQSDLRDQVLLKKGRPEFIYG